MTFLCFSPYFDCMQEHNVIWPRHCQNIHRLITAAICSVTKKIKMSWVLTTANIVEPSSASCLPFSSLGVEEKMWFWEMTWWYLQYLCSSHSWESQRLTLSLMTCRRGSGGGCPAAGCGNGVLLDGAGKALCTSVDTLQGRAITLKHVRIQKETQFCSSRVLRHVLDIY